MDLLDFLFSSSRENPSLTPKEVSVLAEKASPEVIAFVKQGTTTGEMQAIRLYRRETGASLQKALRVINELKWRSSIRQEAS